MDLSRLHDFHFMMGIVMREKLAKLSGLSVFKGITGLSGIVVKILSVLSPVVKREHKWGDQRESRYLPVSGDPEEERVEAHSYLPEKVYRELKLLHVDLNSFSIAQLVRGFLGLFLVLYDRFGDNVIQELENIYKEWRKDACDNRLTLREYLRHILRILRHLPGKNRLFTIYDSNFAPFWIFRL
jgi:hypothetical protein